MNSLQAFIVGLLFFAPIFGFFLNWNGDPIDGASKYFGIAIIITVVALLTKGAWLLLGM
jgi:hypothetical protein